MDERSRVVQARRAQRLAVALGALHHARVELRGAEGDAPAAALQQMARDGGTGLHLRKAYAGHAGRVAGFHQVHARHAAAHDELARGLAAIETRHQQAGGAVGQVGAQQQFFLRAVVVRHADQRLVTLGEQRAVHGLQQVHEQRIGQQRHQHQHLGAALRGQRPGGRIGHVAQALGGFVHAPCQLGIDAALAAQRARGGDRADARGAGHVVQGGAAAGAAGAAGHGHRVNPECMPVIVT
jgi:hypothetical protein